MSDNNSIPGFGWVSNLMRWAQTDRTVAGQDGPLPPPKARSLDKPDDTTGLSDPGGMLGQMGGNLQQFGSEPKSRADLYRIYDEMDKTDIASSVLDLYAEDATQMDPETGRTVWIRSKSKEMIACGDDMFRRLKAEDESTALARDLAKNGDDFERLVYRDGPDGGVQRLLSVPPGEMMRKEHKDGKLEGYTQVNKKFRAGKSSVSYPWDYAHFRLRGHERRFPYGTSILKNAIRPWRQLMILEDWMVQYQVSRHPDRNLFLIDVGSSGDVDAVDMARRFKQKLKRHMIIDPAGTSGRNIDYNFNPILPSEDMVLPIRQNSQTRIEKMAGSGNAPDIAPLNYVMNKLFAAMRAPKGFFGLGDAGAGGDGGVNLKASLCAQDIRYARGAQRIQRALRAGYSYLLEFNYTLLAGNDPENTKYDFNDPSKAFSVHMGPISFLAELERLEVLQIRQAVGMALMDMGRDNPAFKASAWTKYILRDIIRIPGHDLERVLRTADEVIAAQSAILNAKPVDVHTAMPAGVGAQTKLAASNFDLQKDQNDQAKKMDAHQRKLDVAQMNAQAQAESLDNDLGKRAVEAAARARAEGLTNYGEINTADQMALSEVLHRNKHLRHLIEMGVMLWRDGGEEIVEKYGLVLPDRKSALFRLNNTPLADEVTEEDITEMAEEALDEHERGTGD